MYPTGGSHSPPPPQDRDAAMPATFQASASAAAFADFMRSHDPHGGGGGGGPFGAAAAGRAGPTSLISSGSSSGPRRMTSSRAFRPSVSAVVEPGSLRVPAFRSGGNPHAGMMPAGVAMGTMYEDSTTHNHEPSSHHQRAPAVAAARIPDASFGDSGHTSESYHRQQQQQQPLHHRTANLKSDLSSSSVDDLPDDPMPPADLPRAPYQSMLQDLGEIADPSVERARTTMAASQRRFAATHNHQRPHPKPGIPPEPPRVAEEPPVPPSRLGRRILAKPVQRRPDFVVGCPLGDESALPPDAAALGCTSCGAILRVSKHAVVVRCQSCGNVGPAASYRNAPRDR